MEAGIFRLHLVPAAGYVDSVWRPHDHHCHVLPRPEPSLRPRVRSHHKMTEQRFVGAPFAASKQEATGQLNIVSRPQINIASRADV